MQGSHRRLCPKLDAGVRWRRSQGHLFIPPTVKVIDIASTDNLGIVVNPHYLRLSGSCDAFVDDALGHVLLRNTTLRIFERRDLRNPLMRSVPELLVRFRELYCCDAFQSFHSVEVVCVGVQDLQYLILRPAVLLESVSRCGIQPFENIFDAHAIDVEIKLESSHHDVNLVIADC